MEFRVVLPHFGDIPAVFIALIARRIDSAAGNENRIGEGILFSVGQGMEHCAILPHFGDRRAVFVFLIARRIDSAAGNENRIGKGILHSVGQGMQHRTVSPHLGDVLGSVVLNPRRIDHAVGNENRIGSGIPLSVGQGIERPAVFPDDGGIIISARNVNIGVDRHGAGARLAARGGRDGRMSGPDGRNDAFGADRGDGLVAARPCQGLVRGVVGRHRGRQPFGAVERKFERRLAHLDARDANRRGVVLVGASRQQHERRGGKKNLSENGEVGFHNHRCFLRFLIDI